MSKSFQQKKNIEKGGCSEKKTLIFFLLSDEQKKNEEGKKLYEGNKSDLRHFYRDALQPESKMKGKNEKMEETTILHPENKQSFVKKKTDLRRKFLLTHLLSPKKSSLN